MKYKYKVDQDKYHEGYKVRFPSEAMISADGILFLMRNCSKIAANESIWDLLYAFDVLIGRISSIWHQLSRKAREVQPPVAATISGGPSARRSSTVPPMWKLCPRTCASMVDDQIWLQKLRNSCLRRIFDCEEVVAYAKREVDWFMDELMERWFFKAVTGQRMSFRAVRITKAPSSFVILFQGM